MPKGARRYIIALAAVALTVAALVLPNAPWSRANVLLFFALAALYGVIVLAAEFPRAGESPTVAAAVAVQLAALLLLTPDVSAAALTLGALFILLRADISRLRMLFVISGTFLNPMSGGAVHTMLHGTRSMARPEMPNALLPILITSLVLSTVPTLLTAPVIVLSAPARIRSVLRDALRHAIPRNVAYSFVGLLAAVLWRHHAQVLATLVILGPLLVTRWAAAQYAEQRAAHDATVRALVQAVEIKDLYTRGHSERVAKASEMIARRLGMDEERIGILCYAAILHDVGKLGVPTRLLQKDGKFDAAELEAIRVHPVRGVDVVRDIAFLNEAYTAILHHHERMDGRGYPTGLVGENIPRFARIIAVADAFDSMTSTRSYRPARSVADAMDELRACAGSQFDPVMVDAMEAALVEAQRDGQPWLGDGTLPEPIGARAVIDASVTCHDGAALDYEAATAEAAPSGVAGSGVPISGVPTSGVTVNGTVRLVDSGAYSRDGYAGNAYGSDTYSGSNTYDHDDPAFIVPSPLSDEQQAESAPHGAAPRGR
ncbi:MAG TPA: HD-GYP domain-containing protein [Actinocrinis sp.]|uniref:HD-GYP domain-containing protein n=1 Tax=Actinocrinis sp. TaxID=1920516 RepID=UPI002DDD3A25|nr:HD-GYP domain-containing protein [Actinocrinis sp.]HEV2343795.1 HD-GYP domain-containing protein [Actinocrinis sp.]